MDETNLEHLRQLVSKTDSWREWILIQTTLPLLLSVLAAWELSSEFLSFFIILSMTIVIVLVLIFSPATGDRLRLLLGTMLLGVTPYAITSQSIALAVLSLTTPMGNLLNYSLLPITAIFLVTHTRACSQTIHHINTSPLREYPTPRIHFIHTVSIIILAVIINSSSILLFSILFTQQALTSFSVFQALYFVILSIPAGIHVIYPIIYLIDRFRNDLDIWNNIPNSKINPPNKMEDSPPIIEIPIDDWELRTTRLFFFKPIIVASQAFKKLDDEEQEAALEHEIHHLDRGHSVIPGLLGLCGPIFGGRTPILLAFDLTQMELSSDLKARDFTGPDAIMGAIEKASSLSNADIPQASAETNLDDPYRLLYGDEVREASAPTEERRRKEIRMHSDSR